MLSLGQFGVRIWSTCKCESKSSTTRFHSQQLLFVRISSSFMQSPKLFLAHASLHVQGVPTLLWYFKIVNYLTLIPLLFDYYVTNFFFIKYFDQFHCITFCLPFNIMPLNSTILISLKYYNIQNRYWYPKKRKEKKSPSTTSLLNLWKPHLWHFFRYFEELNFFFFFFFIHLKGWISL